MASQPVPAGNCRHRVQRRRRGRARRRRLRGSRPGRGGDGAATRGRLREVLPAAASLDGPVDTTAAVSPQAFGEALRITAAEEGVAALIAMVVQSASAGLLPVLSAARLPVPVTAVVLDQPEAVRLLPGEGRPCPRTPTPKRPPGRWPGPPATAPGGPGRPARCRNSPTCGPAQASSIVASFLARMPGGGWLSAEEADGLLRCYGLPMVEFRRAADADAAVRRRPHSAVTWCSRPTCPACCTRPRPAPSNWTCTAPMRCAPRWAACRPGSPGGCPGCWSSP